MKYLLSIMATVSLLALTGVCLSQKEAVKEKPSDEDLVARFRRPLRGRAQGFLESIPNFTHITFSPDGKEVAACGSDDLGARRSAKIWDVATSRSRNLPEQGTRVEFLAYCPDGKRVLTGYRGEMTLWDPRSGKPLRLEAPTGKGGTVALGVSADGRRVLSGTNEPALTVWELKSGKVRQSLRLGENQEIVTAVLSPDGRRVLMSLHEGKGRSEESALWVWDLDQDRLGKRLGGAGDGGRALCVSRDGRLVAAGSADGFLKVWEVESGREIRSIKVHPRAGVARKDLSGLSKDVLEKLPKEDMESRDIIRSAAFSPTGRFVLTGSFLKKGLQYWEVATGQEVLAFKKAPDYVLAVAISPDGFQGVSHSRGCQMILWDLTTGEEGRTLDGGPTGRPAVFSVAFSPDGKLAASGSEYNAEVYLELASKAQGENWQLEKISSGLIKLWDVETGKRLHLLRGHQGPVHRLLFLPGGKELLSASRDESIIRQWDVKSGRLLRTLIGMDRWVSESAVSGGGRLALAVGEGGVLKLWDLGTGKVVREFVEDAEGVNFARVLAGDKLGISGDIEGVYKVWDLQTGKCVRSWRGARGGAALLRKGGKILLSSGEIWDVSQGKLVGQIIPRNQSTFKGPLALSPDESVVAIAEGDHDIGLWDTGNRKLIRVLREKGLAQWWSSMTFSPDGTLFLAGGADGRLKLWDVKTGRELRSFIHDQDW